MKGYRLRAYFAALLSLTACATSSVPTPGPQAPGSNGGGTSEAVAADIVRLTNDQRAKYLIPRLATSPRLMEAARIHADQMAAFQRMAHDIPGAKYPSLPSRLDAVRYVYSNAAENVAWNHSSAQNAVNGWMGSSGHRKNILDPLFTEIGAAMARSSRGETYWVQVFGRPR